MIMHNGRIIQEKSSNTNNEIKLLYFIEYEVRLEWIIQLFPLCIRHNVLFHIRISIRFKVSAILLVEELNKKRD